MREASDVESGADGQSYTCCRSKGWLRLSRISEIMLTWLVPFEKFALINMHFSALELSGKLLTVTCIFASFLAVDLEGRVDRRCL
jgi:hypothetical protein